MGSVLVVDAEVAGRPGCAVRLKNGLVTEVGDLTPAKREQVVEAGGGALVPGLHDHHCHLLATAAAEQSVDCSVADLRAALAEAAPVGSTGWIRGVGLDGDLDRTALDELRADVPVRILHRGGSVWFLNSRAIAELGLDDGGPEGVERDGSGRATGRLWRADAWLATKDLGRPRLDLAGLGHRLSSYGVTGVTDATPDLPKLTLDLVQAGLPQLVVTLGPAGLASPRKLVISDHDLPGLDGLTAQVREAHGRGRAVAVHAVTAEALFLALAAIEDAGVMPGDRIEHAAVAPPEAVATLARLGLAVCTQPSLMARRGDDYLARVDEVDRPNLWRYRSLLDAGIVVLGSSDAPYGDLDPWVSIAAAADRSTERVSAAEALDGFLREPGTPHAVREVVPGQPADVVLLGRPLAEVLAEPDRAHVRMTFIDGEPVYER